MTKTKAQLRAEAVERLKESRYENLSDYVYAIIGWGHEPHQAKEAKAALLDLLTDDECESDCYTCSKLAELRAENSQLRVKVDELVDERDEALEVCGEALDERDRLLFEVAAKSVTPDSVDADSREKLEADVRKHYAYTARTLLSPDSLNKSTDYLKPLPVDTVFGWLDRQAAITRAELTAQLEAAHAKNRSLKAHIAKMQEGRHGWHVKYPELEKKNAELQAKVNELERENSQLRVKCEDDCGVMTVKSTTPSNSVFVTGMSISSPGYEVVSDTWHMKSATNAYVDTREKLEAREVTDENDDLQDTVAILKSEAGYERKKRVAAEQKLNSLVNRLTEKGVDVHYSDSYCNWTIDFPYGLSSDEYKRVSERDMQRGAHISKLRDERDYWKEQFKKSLCVAIRQQDGENLDKLLTYPTPEGYIEPFQLVTDEIHSLRDFHADDQRLIARLSECKCPGYDAEKHYCNYHAQDFELNDATVSGLKRENAKLEREVNRLNGNLKNMTGARDCWKSRYEKLASELPPIAKDGKPIEIGQLLKGEDMLVWEVEGFDSENEKYPVVGVMRTLDGKKKRNLRPKWLVHLNVDTNGVLGV